MCLFGNGWTKYSSLPFMLVSTCFGTEHVQINHNILQIDKFSLTSIGTLHNFLILLNTSRKLLVKRPEFFRILLLIGKCWIRRTVIWFIHSAIIICPTTWFIQHLDRVSAYVLARRGSWFGFGCWVCPFDAKFVLVVGVVSLGVVSWSSLLHHYASLFGLLTVSLDRIHSDLLNLIPLLHPLLLCIILLLLLLPALPLPHHLYLLLLPQQLLLFQLPLPLKPSLLLLQHLLSLLHLLPLQLQLLIPWFLTPLQLLFLLVQLLRLLDLSLVLGFKHF